MAQLMNGGFNVANFDPTQMKYSFVPSGIYKVHVVDSEVKPTKANDGGYVSFDLLIGEGEHAGSMVALRLNLWNTNQMAVDIANRQFAAMCYAVGKSNAIIQDTRELHNLPFMVRIEEKEGSPYTDKTTGETKPGNKQSEIKTILGLDGKPPSRGVPAMQSAPQQQAQPPVPQPQQAPQQQAPQGQPPAGWGMPPQGQPQQAPQGQPAAPPAWATPQQGNPAPTMPQAGWGGPAANGAAPPAAWGGPTG